MTNLFTYFKRGMLLLHWWLMVRFEQIKYGLIDELTILYNVRKILISHDHILGAYFAWPCIGVVEQSFLFVNMVFRQLLRTSAKCTGHLSFLTKNRYQVTLST